MRPIHIMVTLMLVSACQLSLPQRKADVTNAVTGDPIEVTSLDAPVEGLATAEAVDEESIDTPDPVADDAAETDVDPALSDTVAPVATKNPALQTPAALACIKKGGRYLTVGGSSIARACVTPTRDAGDRCERGSQCDGECLARTGTCAPVTPLYGCTEVLQDNGNRVTLCIE